jgi:hypothetical protein
MTICARPEAVNLRLKSENVCSIGGDCGFYTLSTYDTDEL